MASISEYWPGYLARETEPEWVFTLVFHFKLIHISPENTTFLTLHFEDGLDILRSTLEVLLEVLEVLLKYYYMVLNLDLPGSTLLTYNFQGYVWNPCCKIWIHTARWIFDVINYRSQKMFCLTKLVLSLAFYYVLSIVFLVDFVAENKYIFCYNYCKQTPMLQIATKQSNYKREKALIEFHSVSPSSDHFLLFRICLQWPLCKENKPCWRQKSQKIQCLFLKVN